MILLYRQNAKEENSLDCVLKPMRSEKKFSSYFFDNKKFSNSFLASLFLFVIKFCILFKAFRIIDLQNKDLIESFFVDKSDEKWSENLSDMMSEKLNLKTDLSCYEKTRRISSGNDF